MKTDKMELVERAIRHGYPAFVMIISSMFPWRTLVSLYGFLLTPLFWKEVRTSLATWKDAKRVAAFGRGARRAGMSPELLIELIEKHGALTLAADMSRAEVEKVAALQNKGGPEWPSPGQRH